MMPEDVGKAGKKALDVAEIRRAGEMAKKDEYIINALVKSSTYKNFPDESRVPNWPTIFGLIWGDSMVSHEGFPDDLQLVVSALLEEEMKCQEANDFYEKQIHEVIIELLQVMYEIQVNILIDHLKEAAGIE